MEARVFRYIKGRFSHEADLRGTDVNYVERIEVQTHH